MASKGSAWSSFAAPSLKLLSGSPPSSTPLPGAAPASQSLASPPAVSFLPLAPVQMCPAKAGPGGANAASTDHLKPCDVESLTIAVTPSPSHIWPQFLGLGWLGKLLTEDSKAVPEQIILAPLSGGPTAPAPVCGPLAMRFIRLEFVASPPPSGNEKAKGAKVDLSAKPGPGYCGSNGHALLEISPRPVEVLKGPVIGAPELAGTMRREAFANGQFVFYADKIVSDGFFGSFAAPFQFAWALWDRGDLGKTYSVSLGTCGNRNAPKAVGSLAADIVVYPEALLTIEVTIPTKVQSSTFFEKSGTASWARDRRTGTDGSVYSSTSVETSSTSINRNPLASRDAYGIRDTGTFSKNKNTTGSLAMPHGSKTTFTQGSSVKATEANLRFEDGSSEYFSRTSTEDKFESQGARTNSFNIQGVELGEMLTPGQGPPGFADQLGLKITYNHVTIGGDLKTWRERILIAKILLEDLPRLADRLNANVQVGWGVKGTMKGPSGSIKLVWGLKSSTMRMQVERYCGILGSATIVSAGVELSFGFKLAFGEALSRVGKKTSAELLDARVIGSLTGTVSLAGEFEQLANISKSGKVQLIGDVTAKLQGKLHALKALYIDASVTGGLLFTGGFVANLEERPTLGITAGFKKLVGTATVFAVGHEFWTAGPKVLMPQTEPFFEIDFLKP